MENQALKHTEGLKNKGSRNRDRYREGLKPVKLGRVEGQQKGLECVLREDKQN